MTSTRSWTMTAAVSIAAATLSLSAQNPPPAGQGSQQQQGSTVQPQGQRGGGGGGGQRGGGGGRAQILMLQTSGWADGAVIPVKYSQAGQEVSPPLTWADPPASAVSFALLVHDLDAMTGAGVDLAHWLVWNIPATARELPEGVPQGPQLPDGTRQIGATGPFYRGPAAPATGPAHHYVFELFALDSMIDVAPVGASPANTRTAVVAAMAGHIVGKGTLVGLFRRAPVTP